MIEGLILRFFLNLPCSTKQRAVLKGGSGKDFRKNKSNSREILLFWLFFYILYRVLMNAAKAIG
jgi:hypothetical protein